MRDLALPGNPYDGHTDQAALKRIIGKQKSISQCNLETRLLTPSVPLKTDSQYDQRKQRIRFRKRAGLEATISHFIIISFYAALTFVNGSDLGWIHQLLIYLRQTFSFLSINYLNRIRK